MELSTSADKKSFVILCDSVVLSIFLCATVQQPDSPTKCLDNPTFRVDSPTKPILVLQAIGPTQQ